MSSKTFFMPARDYEYFISIGIRDKEILRQLREETANLKMAMMQISPEQGQFMFMLVKLTQTKTILEIGTFTGYSSLCMAMALPDTGKLIACDSNQDWTTIAKKYWKEAGVEHKIQLQLAPAEQTLNQLLAQGYENHFDFIFIDADKLNYDLYYERALLLVKAGGLIVVDNVLGAGDWLASNPADQHPGAKVIRKLNKKIHEDERVEMCLLPIGEGLTLVRKKDLSFA